MYLEHETTILDAKVTDAESLMDFLRSIKLDDGPMYIYLPGSTETVSGIQVIEVTLTDGSIVRNLRLLR